MAHPLHTTSHAYSPLLSIPELNALGVELMVKGDVLQARSFLTRAVQRISQSLLPDQQVNAAGTPEQQEESQTDSSWVVSSPYENHLGLQDSNMYPHPFVFVPSLSLEEEQQRRTPGVTFQERDNAACAACCLYNLALCYHQEWMKSPECHSQSKVLNKAISLYEKAHAILTRFSVIRQGNDPLMKTLLAICVNLAHCYDFGHGAIGVAHHWRQPLPDLVEIALHGGLFGVAGASPIYRFFLSHALLASYARQCANAA